MESISQERQLEILRDRWQGKRPIKGSPEAEWLEWWELEQKAHLNREKDKEKAANAWESMAVDEPANLDLRDIKTDWQTLSPDLQQRFQRRMVGEPPTQKQKNYANALIYKLPSRVLKQSYKDRLDQVKDRAEMSKLIDELVKMGRP